MKALVDVAIKILQKNGYRITKQRQSLLKYLSGFRNQYVDITTVDEYLHQLYPGMSHNTIYRNLKEFDEMGIVEQRTKNGSTMVKYQCDFVHQHHHHFICRRCGQVQELKMCPMDFFAEQLPGCQIDGHHFELYGLCAKCVNLAKNSKK